MEFLDSRRLPGPNLLFDGPAAVLDVACSAEDADAIEACWRRAVEAMLAALDWRDVEITRKDHIGGLSLGFTAPIDVLYAACEVNQWAWEVCDAELGEGEPPDFEATKATIEASAAEERNPQLIDMQNRALERGVEFLWDDDEASLGLGRSSQTWPVRELPDLDSLDWNGFKRVPVGMITGTNGKTTSVRLAVHVLRVAGHDVGVSSTDWIAVNDEIIDRDDWSGPGGARAVLRRNEVDAAVLETARGGLLRRGLGVEYADASLITNISEDHLGDFGSRDLDELLDIKWIVSHPVRERGQLVLNADDERLVAKAADYPGRVVWFSLDPDNTIVKAHVDSGGSAWVCDGDELIRIEGGSRKLICHDRDIPITLGGAARHNTANALAAAALTACLGASNEAIRDGLATMSQDENPGRCNVYEVKGRRILIDFAHNPKAMQALFDMARALPAKRRALCFGQAGDRPDDLIRELSESAWSIGLDRVFVSELAKYHRGREHGDVFRIIRDELVRLGAREDQVEHNELESETFASAFEWAEDGDLIIMLALGGAAPIQKQIRELEES